MSSQSDFYKMLGFAVAIGTVMSSVEREPEPEQKANAPTLDAVPNQSEANLYYSEQLQADYNKHISQFPTVDFEEVK